MYKKDINISNDDFDINTNILKFLNSEQKKHIKKIQFAVSFNKGENIFKQGAPMSHIVIIIKGMVKIYLEDSNHKNIVLMLVKPGGIISGPGFCTDYKYHFSVTAMEETTACFIEVEDFKKLILENPEFGLKLIGYRNRANIGYYKKFKVITHKQMNGRMADTLLYLSDTIYESDSFETKLTRQDLADMSSMTKESAIRILKVFKSSGVINFTTNHFEIYNKTALINILQNG
ncbi:MAG: Crp/Fnr family transcriptional regulator [Proteobacteria bacterium]|nr:Crp/Fnr family transcriptional regulator [Pseudomonadota bacterium]